MEISEMIESTGKWKILKMSLHSTSPITVKYKTIERHS